MRKSSIISTLPTCCYYIWVGQETLWEFSSSTVSAELCSTPAESDDLIFGAYMYTVDYDIFVQLQ